MPTKNLVSDFGAVGDAQRASPITARITSGTGTLIVGTAVFVVGDIGKAITIWHNNFAGGGLETTITGYTSSTQVTLAATSTLLPSDVTVDMLWGTNNTSAFTGASGWRAYAQTQTNPADPPILQVPDGFYAWKGSTATNGSVHYGCGNSPKITGISGNADNCVFYQLKAGSEFRFGTDGAITSRGIDNVDGNSVRLVTAAAAAGSVFVIDPTTVQSWGNSYGSRIVVGRAVLIACFDVQGLYNNFQGDPPNNYFYEWNAITAYNSGTGEVTLATPLTQAYKSTYPEFGIRTTGFGSDKGGPATMWIAPDGYNTTVTLENLTLSSTQNQCSASIRYVVLNNVKNIGPGLYPTSCDTFTATNCTYPQLLEVDKMVGTVTWNNCTHQGLIQQSASPNRTIINGGTFTEARGGKYFEMNNVAMTSTAQISMGVSSYGRQDRAVLNSVSGITLFGGTGPSSDDLDGQATGTAASSYFTFVGGVIKCLKSANNGVAGQASLLRYFVPGTWLTFDDKYMDQVTDVYEDGTYFYVQFRRTTDWPFTPVSRLKVHNCPDFTMTSCTGTAAQVEDWNQAPARIPLWSYSKRSYIADGTGTTVKAKPFILGRLSTAKFNVTTPGSVTFNESQFNNWTVYKSDYTTYSFGPTIACVNGGLRTITGATTASGAQGSDSIPDLTSIGHLWFAGVSNSGPIFSANGSNAVITVEINTDQGIPDPVDPTVVTVYGSRQNSKWQEGVKNLQVHVRPHFTSDDVKKAAAVLSKMGGIARAKALTATQRSTIASTAAKARWK
jgi:hypothetical protein